jgi:hypothetical protein
MNTRLLALCTIMAVAMSALAMTDMPEELISDLGADPLHDVGMVRAKEAARSTQKGAVKEDAVEALVEVEDPGLNAGVGPPVDSFLELASGSKMRGREGARRRNGRDFSVRISVIAKNDAFVALSTTPTPEGGLNKAYEIKLGGQDGKVCIRDQLDGADTACAAMNTGEGKLLWNKDAGDSDSKDVGKMWGRRHTAATNFEIVKQGGDLKVFVMAKTEKVKLVERTFTTPIHAEYSSVATAEGSTGAWLVCSYKCHRNIYTSDQKAYVGAGHLERYYTPPWDYWKSDFYPEIDKSMGSVDGVDFGEAGTQNGMTLMARVAMAADMRTPWFKTRLNTINFAGSSSVWKPLDAEKYAVGEQIGDGSNNLFQNKWAAQFTANVKIPKTETYYLYTFADDGARIDINDVKKHEMTGVKTEMTWHMSEAALVQGEAKFKVTYYQNTGDMGLWVMWSTKSDVGPNGKCGTASPSQMTCSKAFITVPPRVGGGYGPTDFSRCGGSLAGSLTMRAWKNIGNSANVHSAMQFAQRAPTKVFLATSIYFEHTKGFFAGLDSEYTKKYALRADGYFKAKKTGKYKFWLVSDNGGAMWLDNRNWLNEDIPITVNNDEATSIQGIAPWADKTAEVDLVAGYYPLSAFMYDNGDAGDFELYVQTPDDFGPRNVDCRDFTTNANNAMDDFAYLGCYADTGTPKHDLNTKKGGTGVSINECNTLCEGFMYFGKQGAGECWCGNKFGSDAIPKGSIDYPEDSTDRASVYYNPKACNCEGTSLIAGRQCVFQRQIAGQKNLAFGKPAEASDAPKPAEAWRAVDGFTNHGVLMNEKGAMSNTRSMGCTLVKVNIGKDMWWRVDLGSAHRITSFAITGVSDGAEASSVGLTTRVGDWNGDGASDPACKVGFKAFRGTFFSKCGGPLTGRYFSVWSSEPEQPMVLCEVQVFGDEQDLAVGRPTSQSTTKDGAEASRAVDGNTSGNMDEGSCTETDGTSEEPPWWSVDLQSTASIDTVTIWNRVDCCGERLSAAGHEFEVRVGDHATKYDENVKCGDLHTIAEGKTTATIDCAKKQGRYVFIDIPVGKRVLTLCEVRVKGSSVVEDVAKNKPCGQSSGTNCALALDGNINGNMNAGSCSTTQKDPENTNPWWYVDLQDEYKISSVEVYGRTDCCGDRLANFQVRVGDKKPQNGNLDANRACNEKTNQGMNDYNLFNLNNPALPSVTVKCHNELGNYVSINIPNRADYLALCEVKVYGTKSGKVAVNLALGKTTTQSSTGWNGASSRAVDGNVAGSFESGSCTHTFNEVSKNAGGVSWWMVDLEKEAEVRKVVVYNRNDDCCKNRNNQFQVRVGDQKDEHVLKNPPCGAPSSFNDLSSLNIHCNGAMLGRYVSIDLAAKQDYLSLCEVKVYGEYAQTGLALNKPTVQSSTSSGGYSSRAVDGNSDGVFDNKSCSSTMKQDDPWWYVDLKQSATVKKVIVYNRSDCCGDRLRNFEVRVGDVMPKGSSWSGNPQCGQKHGGDLEEIGGGSLAVSCDGNMVGRYVVIVLPGKDKILTLCEVKVAGAFHSKEYSKCRKDMDRVQEELKQVRSSAAALQKDANAAAGGASAQVAAKMKEDLNAMTVEEQKAKKATTDAGASHTKTVSDNKASHEQALAAKDTIIEGLRADLSVAKSDGSVSAGTAADHKKQISDAELKATTAANLVCTEQQKADAAAFEKLLKSNNDKCADEAKSAEAEADVAVQTEVDKAAAQAKKHLEDIAGMTALKDKAVADHAKAVSDHTKATLDAQKECDQKQVDAREEGRKAGLLACPGVNGLMREIWRLRQQVGTSKSADSSDVAVYGNNRL